jgi:hypothetical protein
MPHAASAPIQALHLVVGESAAGSLRFACDNLGMPGAVIGFSHDLSHGPLGDDAQRADYLRALPCWDASPVESSALLGHWSDFVARLEQAQCSGVVVWVGANVFDMIFLAMACDRLAAWHGRLDCVHVPSIEMRSYVAMHSPDQLAAFFGMRQTLDHADRAALAQEFARIRDCCGPVRRLEQGRVVGIATDHYDELLLSAVGSQWLAAGGVVGAAMGHCDAANAMSDSFFGSRLAALVDAGRVEIDQARTHLRDCLVRLTQS